ncbi:MAG: cystathionine beta-synthase [Candidatus Cloacimonetes bacterium]|jgi:cystathionine beta-synthase|nr:cystathionine beta-synthase [Candidatus Cloacimonadota bacterium]
MSSNAPRAHARPYANVLETIGWTPLIRLNRVTGSTRTPVYAKAEFFNPGGSVKDRIGLAMIEAAEREGRLKPGGVIVEGTSGNTGVGLAIAAAIRGYRCIFTMPDKMSQEKVRLLKAFGAEVVVTPTAVPPDHPDNYVQTAKRIVQETPGAILADQFYNPVNPEAHYRTTGPEIWEQTEGRITHFVASAGTGGTISGVARYLKERNPKIRVIAGDPVGSIFANYHATREKGESAPYKVEGIGNDKLPSTLDFDVIDEYHSVSDRDAFHMARRLTREEGLFVGGSAGLITTLAVQVAQQVDDPDALVVCVLPDTGERYLSKVYNEEWLRENRLLEPERLRAEEMIERKEGAAPALVSVEPHAKLRQALALINTYNISQLPVCHDGRCVGCLAESSLMARVIEDPGVLDRSVEEVMDEPLPVVDAATPMSGVARMLTRQNPAVLVASGGELRGIITRYDVVRYLTQ